MEPPPRNVDTTLFGLFDSADDNESFAGYYLAGVVGPDLVQSRL